VTRFPNPFTAVSELVAKAFATLGDRDGVGGRSAFVVGLSHPRARRSSPPSTPPAQAASTPDGSESGTTSTATTHRRRHTDAR
jgi:hypothetical protein